MADKLTKCILSNMCMVYKDDGILVIDRNKKDWPGISFPGGHIEDGESFEDSIIREIEEETGLKIKHPVLCDVYNWDWGNGVRYLAFLYKTNEFSGEIKSSSEGKVFWIKKNDIEKYQLSTDFLEVFNIIDKR